MSTKNNALVAIAAAALGVTMTAGANPVAEGLLNDFAVTEMGIAQIDDTGRCIIIVTVQNGAGPVQIRPVCAASGDVKLYAEFGAANALIKKAKLSGGTVVRFKRKEKTASVGDPITTLKSQYKSFGVEKLAGEKSQLVIANKLTAADALGWDTAVGTPEAAEYADYMAKQASVNEWIAYCAARVVSLAASLTAAGIDPATVV